MEEKNLYTSLLKGAMVGNLRYADNLATRVADLIEKTNTPGKNIAAFTSDLIYYYGDMLEEDEEQALESAAILEGNPALPDLLRSLEVKYARYFLEMLSRRREKVETVYNDVTARSNVLIDDEDIHDIKKCESLGEAEHAGNIFKNMLRREKNATIELYRKSIHQLEHHVLKNSGEKDEAPELWSVAQCEFRRKLDKKPAETGYYQWRPADDGSFVKTSIFTYFMSICRYRWFDFLRKKATERRHRTELYEGSKSDYENQAFYVPGEESELRDSIFEAIEELGKPCREVVTGKWFGGDYGDGLTSKELAVRIGYSPGSIDNLHPGCLKKLRLILNQKML